jgi:putative oxygen-independent coproporphyrinogen III oxidase
MTAPPTELAVAVAVASVPVIPVAQPPVALYIHVPFCVSLCPYCDFVVYAGAAARGPRNRIDAFLAALTSELHLRANGLDRAYGLPGEAGRPPLASVYLGGGTPSLLGADRIASILAVVRERFGLEPDAEVTVECNPGPDERGDAGAFRDAGVTRLSIGAQSLEARQLVRLGRRHSPDDVAAAVAAARGAGVGSVSLDLLYDLPASSLGDWSADLEAALALSPDHLSLYALTLDDPDAEGLTGFAGDHLPTSRGARRWRDSARVQQDEDVAAAQYTYAVDRLGAAGWRGYEISNWARPGHESRHNLAYWERRPYEAVGPGAHAFDGAVRRWNAARLDAYVAALTPSDGSRPALPPGGEEPLDASTAAAEEVILGLRTDRGVPLAAASVAPLASAFGWARDAALLTVTDDLRVVLTTRGRLLSNELFARLV